MQLFGTSGIRRLADRDLVQLSQQVGLAIGQRYKNVVVGRDTRTSGSALYHALASGILASGARCNDAGIMPTPTLAFVTRQFDAGVMITASHNPPQYNGLKLLNPDGSAFSQLQQKQIEDFVSGQSPINLSWDSMKTAGVYTTAIAEHIACILANISGRIKLRVVVDCGCGASYYISPEVLTRLGCEVVPLNCFANGIFPHDVEPIEANLGDLMAKVKQTGAALGIAHDGDADRVMAVDDLGRFIPGDKLLAIFAGASGSRQIVTTIDASMCVEELGYSVERTRVGDPYVSEALKNGGAGFGGEPSGAWVFPQISLCPDGIYGAARIAEIASHQTLSGLVDSIPAYPVIRGNIRGVIHNIAPLIEKLEQELKPLSVDTIDGIKLNFGNGWLLIRASGTEPKIRISAEAKDALTTGRYFKDGERIISDYIRENL